MRPLGVVKAEVLGETAPYLVDRRVPLEVHIFVLHRAPQAFGEDVVHAATSAIHTDRDRVVRLEDREVLFARILHALVAVVYLRQYRGECVRQRLGAEARFERVRETPCEHPSREPVKVRNEVAEAVRQPYVGDVRTPDVVRTCGTDTGEEVRIDRVLRMRCARFRPGVKRCEAEHAHRGTHRVPADFDAVLSTERHDHTASPIVRMGGVELVNRSLECERFGTRRCRRDVHGRPCDTEELCLPTDGKVARSVNERFACRCATGQLFFGARPVLRPACRSAGGAHPPFAPVLLFSLIRYGWCQRSCAVPLLPSSSRAPPGSGVPHVSLRSQRAYPIR